MPRLPDVYRATILEQQQTQQRLIELAGVAPVRKLYEDMLEEVTAKLDQTAKGTFTHTQLRGMLGQIKLGLAGVLRDMSNVVGDAAFKVGLSSSRSILEEVAKLEKHFTGAFVQLPLLESARLRGLVHGQTSSLLRVHNTSMAAYGTHLIGTFEKHLSSSLIAGENTTQAIDRIQKASDLEWWRAERIVRTELSFASAASTRAALDEQADELDGDLWSRWSEHVSDSGTPLDTRVGVDSEAMHGQVAPPGGQFTQPPRAKSGEEVSDLLAGKSWSHPPNRPNDRAVLTPWRSHWDVPGWIWKGRRVEVTAEMVAKANASYTPKRKAPVQELQEAKPVETPTVVAPIAPPPLPAQPAPPAAAPGVPSGDLQPADWDAFFKIADQLPKEVIDQIDKLSATKAAELVKMTTKIGQPIEPALSKFGIIVPEPEKPAVVKTDWSAFYKKVGNLPDEVQKQIDKMSIESMNKLAKMTQGFDKIDLSVLPEFGVTVPTTVGTQAPDWSWFYKELGKLPNEVQEQVDQLPMDKLDALVAATSKLKLGIAPALPQFGIKMPAVSSSPPVAPPPAPPPKKEKIGPKYGPKAPEVYGPKKPKGYKKSAPVQAPAARNLSQKDFELRRRTFSRALPPEQRDAALVYSGSSYRDINTALRADTLPSDQSLKDTIRHIDEMMEKSLMPDSVIVHRGVNGERMKALFGGLRAGDEFVEKAYTSTAAVKSGAFSGDVMFEITIPQGSRAAPIPSHHEDEFEYLLPRGTKFKVTKSETRRDGTTLISAVIVE